jgi:Zn-dependent membrane protease YugP
LLNGKDLVEYVVQQEGYVVGSDLKVCSTDIHSRTSYLPWRKPIIFLNKNIFDGHDNSCLSTALHETGHFLQNKRNTIWFLVFYMISYFYLGFLVIQLTSILFGVFLQNLSVISILRSWSEIISVLGIIVSIVYGCMYQKNERLADIAAIDVANKHLQNALISKQDPRNASAILNFINQDVKERTKSARNNRIMWISIGIGVSLVNLIFWWILKRRLM